MKNFRSPLRRPGIRESRNEHRLSRLALAGRFWRVIRVSICVFIADQVSVYANFDWGGHCGAYGAGGSWLSWLMPFFTDSKEGRCHRYTFNESLQ